MVPTVLGSDRRYGYEGGVGNRRQEEQQRSKILRNVWVIFD